MVNKGRANSRKKFDWMGGGLVTDPDSHHIEKLAKGKLYNTAIGNADFQRLGSLQRRNGFEPVNGINGIVSTLFNITWGAVLATDYKTTVDNFATFSATVTESVTSTSANTIAVCGKFTANANGNIAFTNGGVTLSSYTNAFKNIRVTIRSNNGSGNPGSIVTNASILVADGYELVGGAYPFFYFPTPVVLVSGTVYWFCIQAEVNASGLIMTTEILNNVPKLFTTAAPCQGIYDYKVNSSSAVTQTPIAVEAGTIWYDAAGTWTSLKTGLASAATDLFDFQTMKNILIVADNATTSNLIWDQVQSTTSPHGYRGTFSIGQSASAGGPWSAAGIVKVMLVTQLDSGGYRASAVGTITLGATTNKIDLTSIAVDAIAAQFSTFDISALATTVYCTLPNGSIYYKVPAVYLSAGGINPIANNDTAESILPMTDAQLIAGGSIESNLTLPTGYFTDQVNTPKAKYLMVFQDFLVMAGDPNNLSSIWISEQYAPNIWSTYGASYGVRIDINTDDGEVITGLQVADGSLFVAKQHNIFRVDYTGDFNDPFRVRLVHGGIGCLSHFTMKAIPSALFFISEVGPAACYGNYSKPLGQTALIQNLFSNNQTVSFNLPQMRYSTSAHDTSRNQVLTNISYNIFNTNPKVGDTVTTRNTMLVYDYEQEQFFLHNGFTCNYLAIVYDSNNFPKVWFGDLSGWVYKRTDDFDNGNATSSDTAFPGSILTTWTTPDMDLGEPTYYKEGVFLEIGGEVVVSNIGVSASSYLCVDIYVDKSQTLKATLVYDMKKTNFATGISIPVPCKFKTIRLRFRSRDLRYSGMTVNWMDFTYEVEGVRH